MATPLTCTDAPGLTVPCTTTALLEARDPSSGPRTFKFKTGAGGLVGVGVGVEVGVGVGVAVGDGVGVGVWVGVGVGTGVGVGVGVGVGGGVGVLGTGVFVGLGVGEGLIVGVGVDVGGGKVAVGVGVWVAATGVGGGGPPAGARSRLWMHPAIANNPSNRTGESNLANRAGRIRRAIWARPRGKGRNMAFSAVAPASSTAEYSQVGG